MNKPFEYWVALMSGALFVFLSHKDKMWPMRLGITMVSAGLGFSQSAELAEWSGRSETFTGMAIVALSWMVLDFSASVFADRDAMKKAFWSRIGGGK